MSSSWKVNVHVLDRRGRKGIPLKWTRVRSTLTRTSDVKNGWNCCKICLVDISKDANALDPWKQQSLPWFICRCWWCEENIDSSFLIPDDGSLRLLPHLHSSLLRWAGFRRAHLLVLVLGFLAHPITSWTACDNYACLLLSFLSPQSGSWPQPGPWCSRMLTRSPGEEIL